VNYSAREFQIYMLDSIMAGGLIELSESIRADARR